MTAEPQGKCPTCNAPVVVTKGADNGLRGADKIASPDSYRFAPTEEPQDLKEALQLLLTEQVTLDGMLERGQRDYTAPVIQQRGRVAAASSRIVALFAKQRKEIERLERRVADDSRNLADAYELIRRRASELERQRETTLTPGEAAYLLDLLPSAAFKNERYIALHTKLRLIAASSPKQSAPGETR